MEKNLLIALILLFFAVALIFIITQQPEALPEPPPVATPTAVPTATALQLEPTPTPEMIIPDGVTVFRLDGDSVGYIELDNHIYNLGVISNDPVDLKAEYEAGFIQGHLQKDLLAITRDNLWDSAYLTDVSQFKERPPTENQTAQAERILSTNYNYTVDYIANKADADVQPKMQRILFRLLGIYHGATLQEPAELDFSGSWMPTLDYFGEEELEMTYGSDEITFMDLYFINGDADLFDVVDDEEEEMSGEEHQNPSSCSAFTKKMPSGEVFFAHNTWSCYLDQSMMQSYYINGDYLTLNSNSPGMIASNSDFGYNNKGIAFLETTHHDTYTEPKADALWMIWRAALMQQFASSLDEGYKYLSLEASGTYMNGYMLLDDKTDEIGLVEMSYKSFVYFKPNANAANGYEVITKPENCSKDYDLEMVQPDYIIGINYPASTQIREDLKALDTRPSRRVQFLAREDTVVDIESAKALITYTDPDNPLSIYGRWDLGYGNTPVPNKVPDGAIDAKTISSSMMSYVYNMSGQLDFESETQTFWMKFGTAKINNTPFIWSESDWSDQPLRNVPDVVDGEFILPNNYMN